MIRRASLTIAVLAAVATVAAGCGGDDDGDTPASREAVEASVRGPSDDGARERAGTVASPAAAERAARRRGRTVRLVDSQFGRILGDGRGQAFYLFDKERRGRSECYGACAEAWPPVLTRGRPIARDGVRAGLLGGTRRRDGTLQVTYRGHPLYYYVRDRPGLVLCHDVVEFGGTWLVLGRSGRAVD